MSGGSLVLLLSSEYFIQNRVLQAQSELGTADAIRSRQSAKIKNTMGRLWQINRGQGT